MRKAEQIVSFIVMIIAAAAYIQTMQFPSLEGFETGPSFVPRIYSIILLVLGAILFLQSFRSSTAKLPEKVKDTLIIMGLMLIYLFLVEWIGFNISTPIILIIFLAYLKVKNWISYVAFPIGVTLCIYFIFQVFLGVPIPEGTIFG